MGQTVESNPVSSDVYFETRSSLLCAGRGWVSKAERIRRRLRGLTKSQVEVGFEQCQVVEKLPGAD
ncbi:hypothetical protein IG631_17360 [Alternaria alternata]|nr:hypothetical protein IG631_17360 [Alternaria alternata]